jgi:hypothetical protein
MGNAMAIGHLDVIKDRYILGWLGCQNEKVIPFITVNETPCNLLAHSTPRPDVAEVTGLPAEAGFIAEIPTSATGPVECKLFAIALSGELTLIAEQHFTIDSITRPDIQHTSSRSPKNVVLVWKQHDAGLYGRRVDQIARAIQNSGDYNQVIILELMTNDQLNYYQKESNRADSDIRFIYHDFIEKKSSKIINGIQHKTFLINENNEFKSQLKDFLDKKELFPTNTVFIVFPIITACVQLRTVINDYKIICDMVDNQLSWSSADPFSLLQEYAHICHQAKIVIFNSAKNRDFFVERGLAKKDNAMLIPNWYRAPKEFLLKKIPKANTTQTHLLYSGNMNDRINWNLIYSLHNATDTNVIIHLVGSADKVADRINYTLSHYPRFVYHGPMREIELLAFAQTCDLAIMPHCHDQFSSYMNPLKLHMYAALQLHCISTNVPGIDPNADHLTVCNTDDEFVKEVLRYVKSPYKKKRIFRFNKNKSINMYLNELKKVFNRL